MMSQLQMIEYVKKLLPDAKGTSKIELHKFEDLCLKTKNCYEIIPDDIPIKLYFDLDYKLKEDESFDEHVVSAVLIWTVKYLSDYYFEKVNTRPIFAVSYAHKSTKYSFHICITKINTTKHFMWDMMKKERNLINKFIQNQEKSYNSRDEGLSTFISLKELPDYDDTDKVLDTSVYKKRGKTQKMRCVHCVKEAEPNRPLIQLSKSEFQEMFGQ